MQEVPHFIPNDNKISLDWANKILRKKSHHILWIFSVDVVVNLFLTIKNAYEMLPIKIVKKNLFRLWTYFSSNQK